MSAPAETSGVAPQVAAPSTPRRGRMCAYARWMLNDFAIERGISIVLVGMLGGMSLVWSAKLGVSSSHTAIPVVANPLLTTLGPLFVFLAVYRMVSADRVSGYYRLQFAKPISMPRFYAQRFALYGIGMLGAVLLLDLLAYAFHVYIPARVLCSTLVVMYMAFGGFHFLLSVITRFDVWMTGMLWFGSYMLWLRYDGIGGFPQLLLYLLPPARQMSDMIRRPDGFAIYAPETAAWLIGYGLVCFVLGLLILRHRPMAAR